MAIPETVDLTGADQPALNAGLGQKIRVSLRGRQRVTEDHAGLRRRR
ncbi:hypothetical protein [Actinomadura sp. HBU206391]|nr:hypothetical protein [Actinomadura sp. HBU206391]